MLKKLLSFVLIFILCLSNVFAINVNVNSVEIKLREDKIILYETTPDFDKYISKVEFVSLVVNALKIPVDISSTWWTKAYIDIAESNQIISHMPENTWAQTISKFEAINIVIGNIEFDKQDISLMDEYITTWSNVPQEYKESVGNAYLLGIGTFDNWNFLTWGDALDLIYKAFYPENRILPKLSEYSKLLSEFTTYTTDATGRNFNVNKAMEAINGTILNPGEEFSYNKVVGNAGKVEGYKIATVLSGGKYVNGYGGGICQDATTLFNAALLANLTITERHNHGLKSSYVNPGYDATVSHGSLDLKFSNSYNTPIKIVGSFNFDTKALTFKVYGSLETILPNVEIYTKGSGRTWTLYRLVDGIQNYSTSSKYRP